MLVINSVQGEVVLIKNLDRKRVKVKKMRL